MSCHDIYRVSRPPVTPECVSWCMQDEQKCNMETTPPPPPKITFKVGNAFPTFAKVKEQIELYSSQNHAPMSICDSRTLKSAVSKNQLAK